MRKQKFTEMFEGVLQDSEIKKIGAEEFNLGWTIGLVGGAARIVGGLFALGPAMNK